MAAEKRVRGLSWDTEELLDVFGEKFGSVLGWFAILDGEYWFPHIFWPPIASCNLQGLT